MIDIDIEINKITLAGMQGINELNDAIQPLIEEYEIEDNSPSALDISKELIELNIDYLAGTIADSEREVRLKQILAKALTVREDNIEPKNELGNEPLQQSNTI